MNVNIKHNIPWWKGGIEIDEIVKGFAERLHMKESYFTMYKPCSQYIQYDNVTMKQFNTIKRRLKNSKKLKDINIEIIANNVY